VPVDACDRLDRATGLELLIAITLPVLPVPSRLGVALTASGAKGGRGEGAREMPARRARER